MGYEVIRGPEGVVEGLKGLAPRFALVIGSTETSTIPGVSIAGASPQATLLTPALDSEYLIAGKVISYDVIPMTPDGIPTPAVISRAVIRAAGIPSLVIDAGSYLVPKIPHAALPSRAVAGRANECRALDPDRAEAILAEARLLGRTAFSSKDLVVVGESIPGGTTTALGIMAGLGYGVWGKVSSAGPSNPHELKARIVREGLAKLGRRDWVGVASCVGDPVHPAMAGLSLGAVEAGAKVVLAGGTQMGAVLAILSNAGHIRRVRGSLIVCTTRWVVEDPSSDIVGIMEEVAPEIPLLAYSYDLRNSPYPGLRKYEEGYVKEGVGIGGLGLAASLLGLSDEEITKAIHEEYGRLAGIGPRD